MTISIWRYCHLLLALVSGLFLLLASVTGIILALEPMQYSFQGYKPQSLSEISLATTVHALEESYDEVLSLTIDTNDFVLADVVTKEGDSKSLYIDPTNGAELGVPRPQHPIFQFTTNLHRSLFLKGVGRFFVGLMSFLLCLIAITGFSLLLKRQGGVKKLFSKIQKDYFELRYHVILSRWFLIPILIMAATGVYLSAEKFSLLPSTKVTHAEFTPGEDVDFGKQSWDLPLFQDIKLSEVRSVNFPFSEFPEDYFELELRDREIYVHQYTGEILSEQYYPFTAVASRWSLVLHTGQGSFVWALVLLLASTSILFFMYTGFVMWRRRVRNSKVQKVKKDKDECTHVILVGSETGNTFGFAKALEKGLTDAGKSVLVAQMNDYTRYAKAEHLLVLTATYGEGEAPTNARNFEKLVKEIPPENSLNYSVVGFGSLTYPSYCQYAIEVNKLLGRTEGFVETVPLYKINNQSFDAFKDWGKKWGIAVGTYFELKPEKKKAKNLKKRNFKVLERTELNSDDTFLIELKPERKLKFQSGDLWEYVPEDGSPRWYSVAKIDDKVVLSVKKHEFGVVSNYLNGVNKKESITGRIKRNHNFHFPSHAPELVCIANGTGIAPFLGMLDENKDRIPIDLYWGGRTKESLAIYKDGLDRAIKNQRLRTLHLALSRQGEKQYVQDLLRNNGAQIAKKLEQGAVFMICGSLAMQNEVLDVLAELSEKLLEKSLSDFEHQEQLLMDCY